MGYFPALTSSKDGEVKKQAAFGNANTPLGSLWSSTLNNVVCPQVCVED
jgi:hypothetical protein